MKLHLMLLVFSLLLSSQAISQDPIKNQLFRTSWINGFKARLSGETLQYHSSHPEANSALLIRCLNKDDYIEWVTDEIDDTNKDEFLTFAWLAGYSVATSTNKHTFYLSVNGKQLLEFTTEPGQAKTDWEVSGSDNSKLYFKFIKLDSVDDFFGYMLLTIPSGLLKESKNARIKIQGDGTNSKDWYMTMQYPLVPKVRISPQRIVTKDEAGGSFHQVKVSIDHFETPIPVKLTLDDSIIESELQLGMNDYFLNYPVQEKQIKKKVVIEQKGTVNEYPVTIAPVKPITFYLLAHSHVDIGYTELQTEVEKKQWDNIEKAMEYSKRSSEYDEDSKFKWNVEVLWAVKSYLEKFPEKKDAFMDAVKKGWIGLDALYGNLQTGLCRPEELYRMLEYSNKLEKENSIKIESAMISDVPGYSWGVVQAFADNGVKYFSVGPNPFDRIGYTLKYWGDKPFYWKSQSGKEKILIWLAGKSYAWFHGWRITRDDLSPINKYLDELEETGYPYDMVQLRYTIGGDNGFPDSTLADFVKNWNAAHVTPKFKIATTMEMFRDFESKYSEKIPTYTGDFTPYWEDGAGSTARETALNRNTAELLVQLETLYSLYDRDNFPRTELDEAWQNLLLFSEHTWGAYNSISEPETRFVTDQWAIKKEFALRADSIAQDLLRRFTGMQGNKSVSNFYVCNPSSWDRSEVIKLPASVNSGKYYVLDENGKKVNTQILANGETAFTAENIPGLGFRRYSISNEKVKEVNPVTSSGRALSNDNLRLVLDDKTPAIKILTLGSSENLLDLNNRYGLNQFIHTGQNAADPVTPEISQVILEEGPVLKTIALKSAARGCNEVQQRITIFNDLNKIDLENIIDKKKVYDKESIRFSFPFNVKDPVTRIDMAWSVIEPEKDQLPGANKNYFTAQRWIDISNNNHGFTVALPDAPFVEIGGMNAEAWMSSPEKLWAETAHSSQLFYSWVMNNSWHTNFKASQEGLTRFRYSLMPHKTFSYSEAYKFGVETGQPLQLLFRNNIDNSFSPVVKLNSASSIVITSLRPAMDQNGYIIRLYNPTDKASSTILSPGNKKADIFLSNGDEEEIQKLKNKIELAPFEVITLKIK